MVGLAVFYIITSIILFVCLSCKHDRLKECEEQLKLTEHSNEILQERVKTLESKNIHYEYLIQEKNLELDNRYGEIIDLNVKLSKKRGKR